MDKIYIYLVSGKSLNGKDSLYQLVKDQVGWKRVAFADKLKNTVMDLYNFTYDQMYGDSKDIEDQRYPNTVDEKRILDETKWSEDEIDLALDNGVKWKSMLVENPNYRPFFTPRRILQIFGQQQRLLFPDIWASYVFTTEIPNYIKEGYSKFIITDVRFKNELDVAQRLKPENCQLTKVRIIRPGIVANSGSNDVSEIDLDDYNQWDYVLCNNSTLDHLKEIGLDMISKVETLSN